MTSSAAELAALAVRERSEERLLEAFVAAARLAASAELSGRPEGGLPELALPFRSARKLELDGDWLVELAAWHLDDEEAVLRAFAARPDRESIEEMGYAESWEDEGFAYRFGS